MSINWHKILGTKFMGPGRILVFRILESLRFTDLLNVLPGWNMVKSVTDAIFWFDIGSKIPRNQEHGGSCCYFISQDDETWVIFSSVGGFF